MTIIGLDGTKNKIAAKDYVIKFGDVRARSKLHLAVRSLLKEIFGSRVILEEVYISSDKLYLDFYIPSANLVVECDGEQHNKMNAHFFSDKLDFKKAQGRDRKKAELCTANNFTLIRLNECNELQWRELIYASFS